MQLQHYHLLVEGRVQGVGFRAATQRTAEHLKVTGWVRNLADGRVEIRAEGPVEALESLLSWVKHGPRWSNVRHIDVQRSATTHGLRGFVIKADGEYCSVLP